MPQRKFQKDKPRVGDPGPQFAPKSKPIIPDAIPDVDDSVNLVRVLLDLGADPKDVFGVDHCYEHCVGEWIEMKGGLTPSCSYSEDAIFCKNCWTWYRRKKALALQ